MTRILISHSTDTQKKKLEAKRMAALNRHELLIRLALAAESALATAQKSGQLTLDDVRYRCTESALAAAS